MLGLVLTFKFSKEAFLHVFSDFRHDVTGEVHHLFKVCAWNTKNECHAAWHGAKEPDVCDWSDELDVTHAFTTNDRAGYFNTTLITDDALVADTFVLTAVTLVVFLRTEDLLIEESVLFRALGAVVNRFWLGDFTTRPFENALRRRKRKTQCVPVACTRGEWLLWITRRSVGYRHSRSVRRLLHTASP